MSTGEALASVEELFRRARDGSPTAWEELYIFARPQLFRFARLRLASDDQAEDAVSETMARAIGAVARYRPGAGVMAWLVGICRNVVRESYRSGGRLRSVDPAQFVLREDTSLELGPVEQVLAQEEVEALRRSFARLDANDQELLALRVVVGLDAEAVAQVIGKRAGAVRMAQSRAMARLRSYLEEEA